MTEAAGTIPNDDRVAIVGVGCRFPGGVDDLPSLDRVLRTGQYTRNAPDQRFMELLRDRNPHLR